MRDASGLQYFLTDHLGSTVAITDSNGTLTSQQRYLPFGGTRTNVTTPNSPGTDFGYTGQRQLDAGMGGLMDYKARFYSPALGRFAQPDSLIPDPANPQAWNRYSYAFNNPVRYNDPSGHCPICLIGVIVVGALILGGDSPRPAEEVSASSAPVIDLGKAIDNLVWDNVPSAIGVKITGGGQAGFVVEAGGSGGLGVVLNWRSMELSVIGEASTNGYIGTPQGVSKNVSLTAFYVYGVSKNKNLEGISDYIGATASNDDIAQFGASITSSQAKTNDGKSLYIDPVSKHPVMTREVSINVGGNLVANGFDAGMTFGRSFTSVENRFTWRFQNWRWRRYNYEN